MVGHGIEPIPVEVDYSLSYAELAGMLGVRSRTVQNTITENPTWRVIDPHQSGQATIDLYPYGLDHDVRGMVQAHRLLIQQQLRPALFHEAVSFAHLVGNTNITWACLGILWGKSANLYYQQYDGQRRLQLSMYLIGKETIIPAVHHSGKWNPLPGMGV